VHAQHEGLIYFCVIHVVCLSVCITVLFAE